MAYRILLHPKAQSFIEGLGANLRERIRARLLTLSEDPKKGRRLKHSDFFHLRIGDYRAIYEIDQKTERIIVLFIGHRRDVYDDFSRLL